MTRILIILLTLISPVTFSQGEHLYIDAENVEKHNVSIKIEKEKYYNRWCTQITYPRNSSYLNEGVFVSINYLLKRDYDDMKKDKAPALYFNLEATRLEESENLSTYFCLAREYYNGAEIQIHYDNNRDDDNYHNIVVWIQNINLLIDKKSQKNEFKKTNAEI